MINFPTKQELEKLQTFDEPHCLTLYVPFIEPNGATNPTQIELKNSIKEAESALQAAGVGEREIKQTLQPARDLIDSEEFWPPKHESLALYLHPNLFRMYHLPAESVKPLIAVGNGFKIEPLLRVMTDNTDYCVLVLGHKNVRLYLGDHYDLQQVELDDLPTDMVKSLHIDEFPQMRELHPLGPSSAGKRSEGFHSQYDVSQTDKAMLLEFFRQIDHFIHPYLRKHDLPLIIAGVEYLQPIYRKANTYPKLLPGGISGNHDHVDKTILREKAWKVLSNSKDTIKNAQLQYTQL